MERQQVARRLSHTETTPQDAAAHRTHGPFGLKGPVGQPDPVRVPIRKDLAHIGLAGRYFVPHFAVPQPRAVMPGGAVLLAEPRHDAASIATLEEGDSFEVLDIAGPFAWGCLSLHGPVGYVAIDRLEQLAG